MQLLDVFSIDNIVLTIFDYPLSLLELVATILSVVNVILAARRKILNWPIGLVAIALMAILFHQSQLYGDFTLQFFFFITSIIGWINWSKFQNNDVVIIERNTLYQNVFWATTIAIATVIAGVFYINCHEWLPVIFPEEPSFPVADGFIAVASVCGQILMMKRRRETYAIWFVVDALATIIYFAKDIKLIALEYAVFTGIAVYGFVKWHLASAQNNETTSQTWHENIRKTTAKIEQRILNMNFIKGVASGNLAPDKFANYLIQDNIYIAKYGELMRSAANITTDTEEQKLLIEVLGADVQAEIDMHNEWMKVNGFEHLANAGLSTSIAMNTDKNDHLQTATTSEYLGHMQVALQESEKAQNLAVFWASILPCAYLYTMICRELVKQAQNNSMNPYQKWIEMYADPVYGVVADQMVEITNKYATSASDQILARMNEVYTRSAELEYDFFEVNSN